MGKKRYKRITVMRQSGFPVTTENLIAFKSEWEKGFDALELELKSKYPDGAEYAANVGELTPKLDELDKSLRAKYPNVENWDWNQTQKNWKKLTKEYGPIAIAMSGDKKKLVYVIMDQIF